MGFMNTEINLLKRKERSYLFLIIILTIVAFAALFLAIYLQKHLVTSKIDTHKLQITAYEAEIRKQENNKLSKQNLLLIQDDIEMIRNEKMIVLPLTAKMMEPLDSPVQMEKYHLSPGEGTEASISKTILLEDLDEAASYMEDINELSYVTNIMFSRIGEKDGAITVDFTTQLDIPLLREELADEDE